MSVNDANLPLPYADDLETVPADESDDSQRVIEALELLLARSQAKSGQFRADVHVKTHGHAQGERVLPSLKGELALGGIKSVRRAYPLSAARRHQHAGVKLEQPPGAPLLKS